MASSHVGHGPADSGHPGRGELAYQTRGTETNQGVAAPPLFGRRGGHHDDVRRRLTVAELLTPNHNAIERVQWCNWRSGSPRMPWTRFWRRRSYGGDGIMVDVDGSCSGRRTRSTVFVPPSTRARHHRVEDDEAKTMDKVSGRGAPPFAGDVEGRR